MHASSVLVFLAPLLALTSANESASGVVYEATVTVAEALPDVTFTSYTTVTLSHGASAPAGPHVSTIVALSTSRWTEYPTATGGAKPTNGTSVVAPKPTGLIATKEQTGAAGRNVVGGAAAIAAAVAAVWAL